MCSWAANVPDWLQQLVDQGGLAVVDVGDDGDVALIGLHRGRALYASNWLKSLLISRVILTLIPHSFSRIHGQSTAFQDRGRDGRQGQRRSRRRRVERHLREALQVGRRRMHRGEPPHLPQPAVQHAGHRAIPVGRDPVRRDRAPEGRPTAACSRNTWRRRASCPASRSTRASSTSRFTRREGHRGPRRPAEAHEGVLRARLPLRQVARGDHHRRRTSRRTPASTPTRTRSRATPRSARKPRSCR